MKHTLLKIAALSAVLSSSTFAINYGLGVEALNTTYTADVSRGTAYTNNEVTDFAADASLAADRYRLNYDAYKTSVILGLKAFASTSLYSQLFVEGDLVVKTGTIEVSDQRQFFFMSDITTDQMSRGTSNITMSIKPSYSFGVKALYGTDSFKIGPELALQGNNVKFKGAIGSVLADFNQPANTGAAADKDLNDIISDGAETQKSLKTASKTTSSVAYGVAATGKLTKNISVNAGYTTTKAKKHTMTLESAISSDEDLQYWWSGSTTAADSTDFESKKPTFETFYLGVNYEM